MNVSILDSVKTQSMRWNHRSFILTQNGKKLWKVSTEMSEAFYSLAEAVSFVTFREKAQFNEE